MYFRSEQVFGTDALQVVEEECPEPKADEVRVRVLAAGFALLDVMIHEGFHPGDARAAVHAGLGSDWRRGPRPSLDRVRQRTQCRNWRVYRREAVAAIDIFAHSLEKRTCRLPGLFNSLSYSTAIVAILLVRAPELTTTAAEVFAARPAGTLQLI